MKESNKMQALISNTEYRSNHSFTPSKSDSSLHPTKQRLPMKKLTYLLVAISLALLSIRIYDSDLSILDDPQVNICDRSTVNSYQCNQSQPLPSIECYYNQANKYLKIHVIPHNHAELGWRFNLNQYYYGIYPEAGPVASSIDAYVFSMLNDPAKHFIQVEIAFFKKWWDEQNSYMKQQVRRLVSNGQLEFVSGGWCLNDEATTNYEDIIEQMTLGHRYLAWPIISRFILLNFGVKPSIGWQIDVLGHSKTQASIFSQMGFNAWFFDRVHDKEKRKANKEFEVIMNDADTSIFLYMFPESYHSPNYLEENELIERPIFDNARDRNFNVDSKAQELISSMRAQSDYIRGSEMIFPLGGDFTWDKGNVIFANVDRIIKYVNENKEKYNAEIFYSTPAKYVKVFLICFKFQALQQQGLSYPTFQGDFFPYSEDNHSFWTGFYTSRVTTKGLIKYYGRYQQFFNRFFSLYFMQRDSTYINKNEQQIKTVLSKLDQALALMQHHQSITGTQRQIVNDNSINRLNSAISDTQYHINQVLSEQQKIRLGEDVRSHSTCLWNASASQCKMTYRELRNNKTVQITVMDGKILPGETEKIRIKVPNIPLRIVDQANQIVKGEVLCLDHRDHHNCDLFFLFTLTDPSQILYFKLIPTTVEQSSITVLQASNKKKSILKDGMRIQMGSAPAFYLQFQFYQSKLNSGAYIFNPSEMHSRGSTYNRFVSSEEYIGEIVQAIRISGIGTSSLVMNFNIPWMSQTYFIQTFIDSIGITDLVGKEIVMSISTDLRNEKNTFYTDSNGLGLQKRTFDSSVPIGGNYYPVSSFIMLENETTKDCVALFNDRSQGGTSRVQGQLELMLHRRLTTDDGKGLQEALNERADGYGLSESIQHYLTFFNREANPNHHRKVQMFSDQPPYHFLSITQTQRFPTLLNTPPPHELHELLFPGQRDQLFKSYLRHWNEDTYLLRVQNFQEVGDISLQVPVDAIETTLTGTQTWEEWQETKYKWNDGHPRYLTGAELKPLEIRTFLLRIPV